MITFKQFNEEAPTTNVSGGEVDMNPTGCPAYKKCDNRKKDSNIQMYRRSLGLAFIKKMLKKAKERNNADE